MKHLTAGSALISRPLVGCTWAIAMCLAGVALSPHRAAAGDLDPALDRLALAAADCGSAFEAQLCPDNRLFRQLVSQYAAAVAPPISTPAHTTGYGGFSVGLHATVTGIDAAQEYWRRGTAARGSGGGPEDVDSSPPSMLVWTRAELRKGLPFGFEVGASAGHGAQTSLWSFGGFVKLAPFEGFREGSWGYVPDFAVRFAVERLVGARDLQLMVPSLDWTLSKPFTIAASARIVPLLGLQTMWIMADTGVVDLAPAEDAFAACMPQPGHALPQGGSPGATLRCGADGDPGGYLNYAVFDSFRATRWRGFVGGRFEHGRWSLTAVFHMDLLAPHAADRAVPGPMPRQVSMLVGGGVGF